MPFVVRLRHPADKTLRLAMWHGSTSGRSTAIKALSADVPVVIVVPPGFYTAVPRPGSAAAAVEAACHSALKRLVAGAGAATSLIITSTTQ